VEIRCIVPPPASRNVWPCDPAHGDSFTDAAQQRGDAPAGVKCSSGSRMPRWSWCCSGCAVQTAHLFNEAGLSHSYPNQCKCGPSVRAGHINSGRPNYLLLNLSQLSPTTDFFSSLHRHGCPPPPLLSSPLLSMLLFLSCICQCLSLDYRPSCWA
jgi:hypothetical protein